MILFEIVFSFTFMLISRKSSNYHLLLYFPLVDNIFNYGQLLCVFISNRKNKDNPNYEKITLEFNFIKELILTAYIVQAFIFSENLLRDPEYKDVTIIILGTLYVIMDSLSVISFKRNGRFRYYYAAETIFFNFQVMFLTCKLSNYFANLSWKTTFIPA